MSKPVDETFASGGTATSLAAGDWRPILPVPDGVSLEVPKLGSLGKPAGLWRYNDQAGRLLGAVCRWEKGDGKQILPLAFCTGPTGERAWQFRQFPEPRPLYRLDDLAARRNVAVLVCEGEKAADAAAEMFPEMVATTSPAGSKAAAKADWTPLAGRDVVIWPDNDEPGAVYAQAVARLARGASARSVRVVALPQDFPGHWDLADPTPEGVTLGTLRALLSSAAQGRSEPSPAPGKPRSDGRAPPLSAREDLIDIGESLGSFWHDPDFAPYASVSKDGHVENYPLDSEAFRLVLAGAYGLAHPRRRKDGTLAPSGVGETALKEAMIALAALARSGPAHEPKVRIGDADGRIYLDLGGETWSSVEIDGAGWRINPQPPLAFIRPAGFRALPEPFPGGQLSDLRPFVNVSNDEDFALLCAFLVTSLRPRGPYWLLALSGEQGSGKSVLSKIIRALLDPNAAPARAAPRDEETLTLAARNGWLVTYDNVSRLSGDLSDALCRLTTGGGFSRRKLQTHDEWLSYMCRPALLNGIPDLTTRADLGDRTLALTLPPIEARKRQTEAEFWEAFGRAQPLILGALYDVVATGLSRQSEVHLARFPRMADAARFACAAAPAMGLDESEMIKILNGNARATALLSLEAWPLLSPLQALLEDRFGHWMGTATDLLAELRSRIPDNVARGQNWPSDATRLGTQLTRHTPALREIGIALERDRSSCSRSITIRRVEEEGEGDVEGVPPC